MNDTQWPRFEVFQQDQPGRPHRNAGSVHAPDAEMALLNARDVFVRRPRCRNLWIVPANAIFKFPDQALKKPPASIEESTRTINRPETYIIFQKRGQRQSMTYVTYTGKVEAMSPQEALAKAFNEFEQDDVYVWWVCPERSILQSNEEDIESLFAPAETKNYRMPREYRVLTEMLEIKSSQEKKQARSE